MMPQMPISVGDSRTFFRGIMATGMSEMMTTCCRGLVDYAFLGGAEIDKYGNINSTVVGDYYIPKVRFPGSGGANDFASLCWRTLIMTVHTKSRFVEKVGFLIPDFVPTSPPPSDSELRILRGEVDPLRLVIGR